MVGRPALTADIDEKMHRLTPTPLFEAARFVLVPGWVVVEFG
jgi:hypothetical protein